MQKFKKTFYALTVFCFTGSVFLKGLNIDISLDSEIYLKSQKIFIEKLGELETKNDIKDLLEDIIKESKSLRKVSGDVRPEWFLLLVLISFFDSNVVSLDRSSLFQNLFFNEYPFIVKKNFIFLYFILIKTK